MSALVGYQSSSDEDEVPEDVFKANFANEVSTEPTPAAIVNGPPTDSFVNTSDLGLSDAPTVGPLLGPAAPANGGIGDEDTSTHTSGKMSERDTIRYLTPAPVPMTSMPPSPPGSPDPTANAKFARFMDFKAKGVHFNEDLVKKSSFLNAGLLATMMARAGIDEEDQYNTSLPTDLWDPKHFPAWAYKEELLKSQQEIRDKEDAEKRAMSAAGKRMIDFGPSGGTSGDSSRKSTPISRKKRRRP
jgi:HCNGP-like protein